MHIHFAASFKKISQLDIFNCIKLLSLLLLLCSCNCNVECVDPDDWGGTTTTTISSYPPDNATVISESGSRQAIPWTQGPQLNGQRVVMVIRNKAMTTSDYENSFQSSNQFGQISQWFDETNSWVSMFGQLIDQASLCVFANNTIAPPTYPWCPAGACNMNLNYNPAINIPCKFYWGLGLYYSIYQNAPGTSEFCGPSQANCSALALAHMGDSIQSIPTNITSLLSFSASAQFFDQGYPTGGASFSPPTPCNNGGCSFYFKIIDNYYGIGGNDNAGSYTVEFKSGVQKSYPQALSKFVGMIKGIMCNVSNSVYTGLISSSGFLPYTRVLLILAIVCLGLGVLTGFLDLTYAQLLMLVLKMGIVIQLSTTETSWNFFSNYLFNFFLNGVDEITGIIFGQSNPDLQAVPITTLPGFPVSPQCQMQTISGFLYFDEVLGEIFSQEIWAKIASLIMAKWWTVSLGVCYCIIIFVCLMLVLFAIIKALCSYLLSIFTISVIIAFAPLFIPFILFERTRDFFKKWLTAITGYFIEPIIILAFAFFLLQVFLAQMHSLLGFRVCWKKVAWLDPLNAWGANTGICAWQPDYDPDPITGQACLLTPNAILTYNCSQDAQGNQVCSGIQQTVQSSSQASPALIPMIGTLAIETFPGLTPCTPAFTSTDTIQQGTDSVCNPYVCMQNRYVGFPYLNTDTNYTPDQERIGEMQNYLLNPSSILLFVAIIWFMNAFGKGVPAIAKQLSGGGGAGVNVSGGGLWAAAQKLGRVPTALGKTLGRASWAALPSSVRKPIEDKLQTMEAIGKGIAAAPGVIKDQIKDKIKEKVADSKERVADGWKKLEEKPGGFLLKPLKWTLKPFKWTAQTLVNPQKAIKSLLHKGISAGAEQISSSAIESVRPAANLAVKGMRMAKDKFSNWWQDYRKKAAAGDVDAMNKLGDMYKTGSGGVSKNRDKARDLYELAAEKGDRKKLLEWHRDDPDSKNLSKVRDRYAKAGDAYKAAEVDEEIHGIETRLAHQPRDKDTLKELASTGKPEYMKELADYYKKEGNFYGARKYYQLASENSQDPVMQRTLKDAIDKMEGNAPGEVKDALDKAAAATTPDERFKAYREAAFKGSSQAFVEAGKILEASAHPGDKEEQKYLEEALSFYHRARDLGNDEGKKAAHKLVLRTDK